MLVQAQKPLGLTGMGNARCGIRDTQGRMPPPLPIPLPPIWAARGPEKNEKLRNAETLRRSDARRHLPPAKDAKLRDRAPSLNQLGDG